jgi:two-component system sensor kinase FixL
MFDETSKAKTQVTDGDLSALEAENKRLIQENKKLSRQAEDVAKANANAAELIVKLEGENQKLARRAEDVAKANAYAAELMIRIEEVNEDLKVEIERRKTAEQKLRQINSEIEEKIQQRTAELTTANERLTDEINQRRQIELSLREHKQRLDTILSVILTGVVIVDDETHEIIDVNPLAASIIGLPREQIIGKFCHQFICPAEKGKCPISDLGQGVDKSERVLLRPNKQKIPILKSVTTANWQGRKYLVESFIDISEQKKIEEHQAQLLRKLESVNRELNNLVYIISHDLKTPLRGINTLVNWLSTDYEDKFDQEGKRRIDLLLSRVSRMYGLIDGILQYSGIGHIAEEMTSINLNYLVSDIIDRIVPSENITITVENELPVIECEKKHISQAFENLLSNAIRYMDKPQGHIKIGCVQEQGCWRFSVADNGPGIEERYFEKVFRIFQTLSTKDEINSVGVGLTIVKKIIELHGGRIWVESKVGHGSTFFFTLPKQEVGVESKPLEAGIVC